MWSIFEHVLKSPTNPVGYGSAPLSQPTVAISQCDVGDSRACAQIPDKSSGIWLCPAVPTHGGHIPVWLVETTSQWDMANQGVLWLWEATPPPNGIRQTGVCPTPMLAGSNGCAHGIATRCAHRTAPNVTQTTVGCCHPMCIPTNAGCTPQ